MRTLIAAFCLFVAFPVRAEQFLGEESPEAEREGQGEHKPRSNAKSESDIPEADARQTQQLSVSPLSGYESDPISFAAMLAAGSGFVSGVGSIDYALYRFLGLAGSYEFTKFDFGATAGQQYGPEMDAVLRFPSKTVFMPYAGAGPGYVKWNRLYEGESYDEGATFTANAFVGLAVRLTPHFGIRAERRQLKYLAKVPRRFDDRDKSESRESMTTNIGFLVRF